MRILFSSFFLMSLLLGCSQSRQPTFNDLPEAHEGDYSGSLLPFPAPLAVLPTLSGEFSKEVGLSAMEVYRWGYLTRDGKMIVEPGEYSLVDPADSGGGAVFRVTERVEEKDRVRVTSTYGVMNLSKGTPCPQRFPVIRPMSEGFARALPSEQGFVVEKAVFLNGDCEVIAEVDSQEKSLSDVGDFSEGLARVRKVMTLGEMRPRLSETMLADLAERGWKEDSQMVNNGETFKGYIDQTGAFVIPPRFYYATDFSDGLAAVVEGPANKVGFIDKSGAWAIEPAFSMAGSFHHALAVVWQERQCGYITKTGKWAIEPSYTNCQPAGEARVVVSKEGRWLALNHDGSPTTHLDAYSGMEIVRFAPECEGLLPVKVDVGDGQRWSLINAAGMMVIPPILKNFDFPCMRDGALLAIVDPPEGAPDIEALRGGLYIQWGGYLNAQGAWIHGPVPGPWTEADNR